MKSWSLPGVFIVALLFAIPASAQALSIEGTYTLISLPGHGHPSSCRPRRTDRVVGRGPGAATHRPAKKMRYFSAPSSLAQGFSPYRLACVRGTGVLTI